MTSSSSASRLTFLDWSRGLATVTMLNGHVFHSFLSKDLRNDGPFVLSQFVGGLPPAVFLFLTGVTMAFLMNRSERRQEPLRQRWLTALRRAGYLLGVAMLFRIQLWVFAWGQSAWTDLLRVDILNAMALALAAFSGMTVFTTVERVRLCAVLGVCVAAASPLLSQLDWSGAPSLLKAYLAPDANSFAFFPWAAFVAFGMSAGSILCLTPSTDRPRLMQWAALFGVVLVLGAQYFGNLPYSLYAKSDFWLDSPALVLIKLGVILLILSFAYLWVEHAPAGGFSWVQQLGTHSLLVYWVHTELVYGRWFGHWKESLGLGQTLVMSACVILSMLGLSVLKSRLEQWRREPAPVPNVAVSCD